MDRNDLGNLFFRYRGQIPIAFILFSLVAYYFLDFAIVAPANIEKLNFLAASLVIVGILFRCLSIGFAAPHSSGRNRNKQVAEKLNTLGTYSMVQNPLYFANALLWIATSLFSNQWSFVVAALALSTTLLTFIILHERKFLLQRFGAAFLKWDVKTPIFWPNPFLFKAPSGPFQWIRLFATEYPTWISVCAGIFLCQWLFYYKINKTFEVNDLQVGLCIAAFLIALTGRFFKYVVVRKWLKMPI